MNHNHNLAFVLLWICFSIQLQLLILSNGTTIPVTAEEGLQLLSSLNFQAALVPFGYSVVHYQAGRQLVTCTCIF